MEPSGRGRDGTAESRITRWIAEAAVRTVEPSELVRGLAERLREEGLGLGRLWVGADILHPTIGARTVSWSRSRGLEATGFARNLRRDLDDPQWRATPLRLLLMEGLSEFRRRLATDYCKGEFALLDGFLDAGLTDYLACAVRFPQGTLVGDSAVMVATFASEAPGGFTEPEVELLRVTVRQLALAWRSILLLDALRAVTGTYLGADAARRVLSGRIARGEVETIRAAIWFSDLEGFTTLGAALPKERLMALLNDYAGVVIETVERHGGQVLKLIGDGVLAIFSLDAGGTACRWALDAAIAALDAVDRLSTDRRTAGEPATRMFVGLHLGEVLYGNIGSADRLDFTVLGPAVNEAARLERMCRSLEQRVIVSASFAAEAGPERARLISLGRYALRGVARPQELFTLDPERSLGILTGA